MILEMFRKGNFSTYQVAKELVLSSGGAKKLVDDIALGGIIKRVASMRESRRGRMPLTYGLNPNYCSIVVINFANCSITLFDLCGNVIDNAELETCESIRDSHIYDTARLLHEMLEKEDNKKYSLAAISIVYLGKLHENTCENYFSGMFEHCTINLYQYFTKEFNVEVIVRNDLHFAIFAERQHGVLTGLETSCCYMQIGRGCACSFLINDKLYVGASGLAGEIGHNTIIGGKGVLENYIDWFSAKERIRQSLARSQGSALHKENFSREDAVAAYKNGDPVVCSVIDEMARNAGIMLKNLTELIDFDVFILSVPMVEFGIRDYRILTETFFKFGYQHVKVVVSTLGERSIELGAFEFARDMIFKRFVESRLNQSETQKK